MSLLKEIVIFCSKTSLASECFLHVPSIIQKQCLAEGDNSSKQLVLIYSNLHLLLKTRKLCLLDTNNAPVQHLSQGSEHYSILFIIRAPNKRGY